MSRECIRSSPTTVESHGQRVHEKLGLQRRDDHVAVELGLLAPAS